MEHKNAYEEAIYYMENADEEYNTRIAKHNKKILASLDVIYSTLHLGAYYSGSKSVKNMRLGFDECHFIIEQIKV